MTHQILTVQNPSMNSAQTCLNQSNSAVYVATIYRPNQDLLLTRTYLYLASPFFMSMMAWLASFIGLC